LALDIPMIEPPVLCMRDVSLMVSSSIWLVSPSAIHLKPSLIPITSKPLLIASIVAALMTPFIPGAGPPPTSMASLFLLRLFVPDMTFSFSLLSSGTHNVIRIARRKFT
jgi:hypothetical protein